MKLRLSWSKLSSWAYYSKEDCINAILGYPNIPTDKMVDGSNAHKYIETNKLVLVDQLESTGRWEYKDVVNVLDWLDVSFVVDYWEGNSIVDFKTGSFNEMQLKVYAFLMALKDIQIDYGYFVEIGWNGKQVRVKRYRGFKDKVGGKKIHRMEFNQDTHKEAYEFIKSNATEIRNYLISMGYK